MPPDVCHRCCPVELGLPLMRVWMHHIRFRKVGFDLASLKPEKKSISALMHRMIVEFPQSTGKLCPFSTERLRVLPESRTQG